LPPVRCESCSCGRRIWLQAKRTALYRLDAVARRIVPILDLPSAGDTAFPSVARLGPDDFLVANYTSPIGNAAQSWLSGQLNETGIYFVRVSFAAQSDRRPPPAVLGPATAAAAAHTLRP
jgi:hypothetical protein